MAGATGINYTGSSTIGKFIADAALVYGRAAFTITTLPESAGGATCVGTGSCDIGGVAREVDAPPGVVKTLIGYDVIAVVVNTDNPH